MNAPEDGGVDREVRVGIGEIAPITPAGTRWAIEQAPGIEVGSSSPAGRVIAAAASRSTWTQNARLNSENRRDAPVSRAGAAALGWQHGTG